MSHSNHYFQPEADDIFDQNELGYPHYTQIDFAGPSNYQHTAAAGSNARGHHHMGDGGPIRSMFSSSQHGGWNVIGYPPAPSTLYRATDQVLGPTASYDSTSAFMDEYSIPSAVSPTEMDGPLDDASLEDWEEDMAAARIEPSARKGKGKGKKTRKAYDEVRLGEVNLTRAIGACLVCRISRVKVCNLVNEILNMLTYPSAISKYLAKSVARTMTLTYCCTVSVSDKAWCPPGLTQPVRILVLKSILHC